MAKSKSIFISNGKVNCDTGYKASGIDITYISSRKVLNIGGWYDGCVGIESAEITLDDFLKLLGIKKGGE